MRARDTRQLFDGGVVQDRFPVEQAAMSVRGVLAQADIGDDQQFRHFPLDRPDRHLHRSLRIVGGFARFVLFVR